MEKKREKLTLPEGVFDVEVIHFDNSDKKEVIDIYKMWRGLCDKLLAFGARGINLPEGLSEVAFCLAMGSVRVVSSISGANSSFDCYDLKNKKRIQVKACSVLPDLTSFGPKSQWDEIYFMDFYANGKWDGAFDIYKVDTADVYNYKVNATQTVKDQQLLGKRPRFSMYTGIIQQKDIRAVFSGNIYSL